MQTEGASDSGVEGARAFASKIFSGFSQTRDRVLNATNLSAKARDEWKDAAAELFGTKQKGTVDEALASVKTPTMTMKQKSEDGEEAEEYTGPSALVAVKEDESAWQKISARFRETPIITGIMEAAKKAARTEAGKKVGEKAKLAKDKIGDATEEVLEIWETSQNPYVNTLILAMTLHSGFDTLEFADGYTDYRPFTMAFLARRLWPWLSSTCFYCDSVRLRNIDKLTAMLFYREIRRAEPDFILEEWKQKIEDIVLPGVLEAFLRGNTRDLKKWFGEAAYAQFNIAIRERKTEGESIPA